MSLETLTTISPTTNKPVHSTPATPQETLSQLPTLSTVAFTSYHTISLSERQSIVSKALSLLSSKRDELAKELTEHMGRPIAYTAKEIDTAVKRGEYLLKISGEVLDGKVDGEKEKEFSRYIKRVPVGPVLVIFAWNVSTCRILLSSE
jgi:acyl-CoA reductase-like NAD-dependent aldehyde dehydrogenase